MARGIGGKGEFTLGRALTPALSRWEKVMIEIRLQRERERQQKSGKEIWLVSRICG